MPNSSVKAVVVAVVPVLLMLLAAGLQGGWQPWFAYVLAALAIALLSAWAGPVLVQPLIRRFGRRRALLVVAVGGWAALSAALTGINLVQAQQISWALYPTIGLLAWPLAVWCLVPPDNLAGQ